MGKEVHIVTKNEGKEIAAGAITGAAASVIAVNFQNLESCQRRLQELAQRISSRRLILPFSRCEGELVVELNHLAGKLCQTGEVFGKLIESTSTRVKAAEEAFHVEESVSSAQFR